MMQISGEKRKGPKMDRKKPEWKEPELAERAVIAAALNKLEPHYKFNPDEIGIGLLDLPFYSNGCLVRIHKTGKPLWYVRIGNEFVPLDGSSANLNYLEVKGGVADKTETAYLHFRHAFGQRELPEDFSLPPPSC